MPHIFDYAPIFIQIYLDSPCIPQILQFNTKMLKIQVYRPILLQAQIQTLLVCNQNQNAKITTNIKSIKEISHQKSKKRKMKQQKDFEKQYLEVYNAQIALQDH